MAGARAAVTAACKPAAAESKLPAPNPNAPVVVELRQSGDTLRAEFPFVVGNAGRRVPARRYAVAGVRQRRQDRSYRASIDDTSRVIRSATLERGADGEAIVRIKLERPRLISLEADGPGWIVTIGDTATVPSRPLVIARSVVGKNRASIAIPFDHPRQAPSSSPTATSATG